MSEPRLLPRVAAEWFIVRAIDAELLVYDLRTQAVTSLNPFAASVWRACDGQSDANAIATKLVNEGIAVADLRAVDLALDMLSGANLIEDRMIASRKKLSGKNRREFFRNLAAGGAVAAAIATPAIVSILAPTPAQAASGESGSCGGVECGGATPYCNFENECVQCIHYEECVEIELEFCDNFECF